MKKGFTLIELLAVILILGIIALIAIPTVNNILKEARKGAFSSTLNNLNKAIEEKCTMEQIINQTITTGYTISHGVISPSLDIKGDLPDGTIVVNSNCEVAFTLSNTNFTATKDFVGDIVILDGKTNTEMIYKESILNGTDPILSDNLIPITIDNDGTVRKADIKSKWYSYAEKKWANAVMLTASGKVEQDGTILENSIESYFVWIPRYKYKLFNMGNYNDALASKPAESSVTTIDIIFETKDKTISVGTNIGEYHSHPAFQAFNTNGLWVGKFETSGNTSNIKIKPNQQSLRYINIKTMFDTSYNYKRSNESHMMKNTEWGAVTYLTLSKYGINKIVNINNNSDRITGYSSVINIDDINFTGAYNTNASVTLPYNTETGYKASTTGNITGIYDMSGGVEEYMAAYNSESSVLGESGFSSDPASTYGSKYFDVYPSSSVRTYYNRILGDATGELGPFYDNGIYLSSNWWDSFPFFVDEMNPWFYRGGYYGIKSRGNILSFHRYNGDEVGENTFRIVLAN